MDDTNIAGPLMGGLLVEVFVACIIYGITCLQVLIYYQGYPNDRPFLKYLVATVWLLETVHTAFCIQFVYDYLITGFGNTSKLLTVNWGVGITILCGAGVSYFVQGYYIWRIWIVSNKSIVWTGIIVIIGLAEVAFGVACGLLCYVFPLWPGLRAKRETLIMISGALGLSALVDILIAVTLIVYLKRRSSGLRESKTMVNHILLYAVNTGAITCFVSLLGVILFAIKKHNLVYLGLFEIQVKLYSNSFLGSLNAREHIRSSGLQPYASSISTFRAGHPRMPMQHTVIEEDRPSRTAESTHLDLKSLHLPTESGGSSMFNPAESEFP